MKRPMKMTDTTLRRCVAVGVTAGAVKNQQKRVTT